METLIGQFPYAGLFLLPILGGLGVPFSEDVIFTACGLLLYTGIVKALPAFALTYSGVLISDSMTYVLGRKWGRSILRGKWFHRFSPPEGLARLEEKFRKKGVYLILLGRQVMGLRFQVLLFAGVLRMPFRRFLFVDAVAAILTIALWTSVGYGGGRGLESLGILKRIRDLLLSLGL